MKMMIMNRFLNIVILIVPFALVANVLADYELILNKEYGYYFREPNLENANDSSANTFSIIGTFNDTKRREYEMSDGKYQFKLIYGYHDLTNDILEWKQSNWLTDENITGADLFGVPPQTFAQDDPEGRHFFGLGLNVYNSQWSLLDGTGISHIHYWNSVGMKQRFYQTLGGIPAFDGKTANTTTLFVWKDTNTQTISSVYPSTFPSTSPVYIPTQSPTNIITKSPTKSPIIPPTNTPTKSPTSIPTKSPIMSPIATPTKSLNIPTTKLSLRPTLYVNIQNSHKPTYEMDGEVSDVEMASTFYNKSKHKFIDNRNTNYIIIAVLALCLILGLFVFFCFLLIAMRKHKQIKITHNAMTKGIVITNPKMSNVSQLSPTIDSNINVSSEREGNVYNINIDKCNENEIVTPHGPITPITPITPMDNNKQNCNDVFIFNTCEFGETYQQNITEPNDNITIGNDTQKIKQTLGNENDMCNLGIDEFIIE